MNKEPHGHTAVPPAAWVLPFASLAVISAVLGFIGLREYLPSRTGFGQSTLDLVYYDLQLFVIQSAPVSNGGPYPLALEIARFGAPAATAYALLTTFILLLDTQRRELRFRLARGHAVVCGGGPAALLLAERLRAAGRHVVLVDEDASSAGTARALGLLHVLGDPREEGVLRRAGTARAAEVFILGPDSAASAATVLTATRITGRDGMPVCYAAIADRDVYAGLLARHLGLAGSLRRLHLLNLDEIAAHAMLDAEPSLEARAAGPHAVVIGLGGLGQALVLELARRRHASRAHSEYPLWITMVDANATAVARRLKSQMPMFGESCWIRELDLHPADLDEEWLASLAPGLPPDRVYVCCDDDVVALRVGMQMLLQLRRYSMRVVVCVAQGAAFSEAFHGRGSLFDDAGGSLRVLPVLELLARPELVRGLVMERLARALHGSYLEGCYERGESPGGRPALRPWEELSEDLRESTREHARSVGEKLAEIDCFLVPHFDPNLEFRYRDEHEVTRLARKEHDRWVGERRSGGYEHGPERDGRHHPDLVDWEHLSEEARQKDVKFIVDLPHLLAEAGFQVLRLPNEPEPGPTLRAPERHHGHLARRPHPRRHRPGRGAPRS